MLIVAGAGGGFPVTLGIWSWILPVSEVDFCSGVELVVTMNRLVVALCILPLLLQDSTFVEAAWKTLNGKRANELHPYDYSFLHFVVLCFLSFPSNFLCKTPNFELVWNLSVAKAFLLF